MTRHTCLLLLTLTLAAVFTRAHSKTCPCAVAARTEAGWVCGLKRKADDGTNYASFRGVPYAKPPLGHLRFKELEPVEPWSGCRDASEEGPVCLQTDIFYGKVMQSHGMSEDCMFANIHSPIEDLALSVPGRELKPPKESIKMSSGLPVIVFIHGGGFAFGSGDSDLHGPEYLVSKKVVVITFNYRLNVFGFLSLNTSQVPGNAGLRDMVTLLRWVQRNVRAFGGDPDNVTLAGQSAGAIAAHLLTMSSAAQGLFKRAILMSGTATSGVYSPSPYFAKFIETQLLKTLSINSTDPEDIYQQLISLPAEKLTEANGFLIEQMGLTTFVPTVESEFPGVTRIVEDYPDALLAKGRGSDIPLLVGYTNSECETFRTRLEKFELVKKSKDNLFIIVPPKTLFATMPIFLTDVAKKIESKYYNGTISLDGFINACTDGFYEYPVLKLAESRYKAEADLYVYRFSYESTNSVLKVVDNLTYHGAGHVEDLTYVFKVNSVVGSKTSYPPMDDDDIMKNVMTTYFFNFMVYGKPICNLESSSEIWPTTSRDQFLYEDIHSPYNHRVRSISSKQQQIIKFFDNLNNVD